MAKKKWLNIGSVRKSEKGGFYLKVDEDVTLKAGMSLQLEKPADAIDRLCDLGYIESDVAEERKAKVPDYIKFDVKLPPARD